MSRPTISTLLDKLDIKLAQFVLMALGPLLDHESSLQIQIPIMNHCKEIDSDVDELGFRAELT